MRFTLPIGPVPGVGGKHSPAAAFTATVLGSSHQSPPAWPLWHTDPRLPGVARGRVRAWGGGRASGSMAGRRLRSSCERSECGWQGGGARLKLACSSPGGAVGSDLERRSCENASSESR